MDRGLTGESPQYPALRGRDRDHIAGLAKGLRLLEAFNADRPRLTPSQAARLTGISPAAARRCLLTLQELGYVGFDGRGYVLDHGVLRMAHAYAVSTRLPRLTQPALDALSERTRESVTVAVLDGASVVIAARCTARKTMRMGLGVGSGLPLHCSAAGRVLLASMPDEQALALLRGVPMPALTARTAVGTEALIDALARCRQTGYASCDEEIELGVRSIAVPILDRGGDTVAAMSISSHSARMTVSEMVRRYLPELQAGRDWVRQRWV